MGRAFHQLRLMHLALPFYELVLKMAQPPLAPVLAYTVRLAAFNLSRLHKECGQPALAHRVLATHCRV
jgi:hypothetical protein